MLPKQMIHLVFFICLFERLSSNSIVNNLPENSSDPIVDDINISKLTEDLRNLGDSLKKLKEVKESLMKLKDLVFNRFNISSKKQNDDDEQSMIIYDENNRDSDKVDKLSIDIESEDISNEIYNKAILLLKSTKSKKAAYALLQEASNLGNNKAKSKLAWSYLFGVPFLQNISAALYVFQELSEIGHPEGHTGLGMLYSLGVGVPRSEERALLHLTIAGLGGSVWARMALGYRYMNGISVIPDCEKALHYYRGVAEEVIADFKPRDATRNNKISILDEEDKKNYGIIKKVVDVKNFYEMMAEIGDAQAQISLGKMYYHGTLGLESDFKKSLRYFKLAEKNKNIEATAYVGKIYFEGSENINVNFEEAYIHFKKSALLENYVGEAGLGMMYLDGKYVTKDYYKAFHYLSKSAERGWVEAIISLAKMYFDGIGIRKDYTMANRYFRTAAQSGHVLAFYYLGKMHENGFGSFRSCLTAVELYKAVAEKGRWDSLFVAAYNKYTQRSYKEAYMMFSLLAEIGYADGQLNAAMLLDDFVLDLPYPDSFIKEDSRVFTYRKAIQYWNRAGQQGEKQALTRLGDHFYYGLGVDVNYETASAYYREAGFKYNNAEAMYNLGYMHQYGVGLLRDFYLANRFYELALEMNEEGWLPLRIALIKLKIDQSLHPILGLSFVNHIKNIIGSVLPYWDFIAVIILGGIGSLLLQYRQGVALHRLLINWIHIV